MCLRQLMVCLLLSGCAISRSQTAEAPPGSVAIHGALSSRERTALVALYRTTGGDNWKRQDAWLGLAGTECEWYGITCQFNGSKATVTALRLYENDLKGTLPRELDDLANMNELLLFGNHLSGDIPPGILQKFDSGRLRFLGYAGQFSPVSAIRLTVVPGGVLCGDYEAVILLDGSVTLKSKVCRNTTDADRATYWETKSGSVDRYAGDFDRLARLSETLAIDSVAGEYDRAITHGIAETLVIERGKQPAIVVRDYADAAPAAVWVMKRSIAGALFNAVWETVEFSEPVVE